MYRHTFSEPVINGDLVYKLKRTYRWKVFVAPSLSLSEILPDQFKLIVKLKL